MKLTVWQKILQTINMIRDYYLKLIKNTDNSMARKYITLF
jgi:hypothetical protein